MNSVLKSLEEITTGYSVFEKDQVLTHDQLNSVPSYFDDQTRLTRIKLLGVGIVCGLRVSVQGGLVNVTKGAGVTTDGDLLYFAADTVFDQFKRYDESNPVYAPFYVQGGMIKVYELVPQGTTDPRASALSEFGARTGSSLNNLVAVLFMEAYVKDEDLCTGTDCDNLGQDFVNTLRLLLIDQSSVGLLNQQIATPDRASGALGEIVADRPLLGAGISSLANLAGFYRAACSAIHDKLTVELPKLYPNGSAFLGGVFPSDPASGWLATLNAVKTSFASNDSGIQYYYDFLKDVVETWNHFRERLVGDMTWCCPDPDSFPKHLLLGNVVAAAPVAPTIPFGEVAVPIAVELSTPPVAAPVPTTAPFATSPIALGPIAALAITGTDADANRTGFYPSPVVSRTVEQLNHARFLAQKLNALIQTFQVPASAGDIRITPSRFEDDRLEDRAIPYYYQVNPTSAIQRNWNYRLHQQGMDAWNYSYNAAAYGAQGGAANPLTSQLGRFSFFRIEGHLGMDASAALASIEAKIRDNNLPFTVRAVLLGTDSSGVAKKPGIRYTDINRLHYLLRQAVSSQLNETSQFSGHFTNLVNQKVVDAQAPGVKALAAQNHAVILNAAAAAQSKLNRPYADYAADVTWKNDLNATMHAAAQYKYNVGSVALADTEIPSKVVVDSLVKTEFTSPFDTLVAGTHAPWLDWLDQIIQAKNRQQDDQLLFGNFVSLHPGLEHFSGVVRGGTFVLVHDSNKHVVADFMVPYYLPDTTGPQPAEPGLTLAQPLQKPGAIFDYGIRITQPLSNYLTDKLTSFQTNKVQPLLQAQVGSFSNSLSLVASAFSSLRATDLAKTTFDPTKTTVDPTRIAVDPVNLGGAVATTPIATVPIATAPIATAPIATAPVATAPIATAPIATAPIATAPIATAPIATAPIATAPIATAPIATAPIATAPMTTSPIATVPIPSPIVHGLVAKIAKSAVSTPTSPEPSAEAPAPEESADPDLEKAVNEVKSNQRKVVSLRKKLNQPALSAERKSDYHKQAKAAETGLARSIHHTARYISESGTNVSPGSKGFRAVTLLSDGLKLLTDRRSLTSVKKALTTLRDKTTHAGLKSLLDRMLDL